MVCSWPEGVLQLADFVLEEEGLDSFDGCDQRGLVTCSIKIFEAYEALYLLVVILN